MDKTEQQLIWAVYLLECADGTLYCGTTTDIDRRLRQHNGELSGGARYTQSRRPVRLAAYAECGSRSEALKLEHSVRLQRSDKKIDFLEKQKNRL